MGRFGIQILIDRPSRDDYAHILHAHIGNVPINEEIDLNEVALLLPDDLSASDLMGIVVRTKENAIDRHKELDLESSEFQIERDDFPW
jgi:ATP-dependent Zn protease